MKYRHPLTTVLASAALLTVLAAPTSGAAEIQPLNTAVIKATSGLCLRGTICHVDKAGVWIPQKRVAIVSVLAAEQADVALYVDLEVSTRPEMYQCAGNDSNGCIFRMKYAGPGLFSYGANQGSTYLGSNVTDTGISFPTGYGIVVPAGTPVYVHLDVRNQSLIDLKVDQDAWVYYVPLD